MHSNGGEFHPYSRKLQRLLGHGAVCADCGEPGACADALARSLPSRLEKSDSRLRRRWTHVAILAGTNDLRFGAPAEAVISSLATAAAAHSGATAIALTLPQIRGEEKSSLGKRRAIVNGWLRDKATARRRVCAAAAVPRGCHAHGRRGHFTRKGYDIIAEVVRAAMKQGDSGRGGDLMLIQKRPCGDRQRRGRGAENKRRVEPRATPHGRRNSRGPTPLPHGHLRTRVPGRLFAAVAGRGAPARAG